MVGGCGGSAPPAVKAVRGTGYRFNAPAEWAVVRGGRAVQASEGLQLVSVTRDRNGAVIEGNPEKVTDVTDVWTFARDVSSRDPNWKLVATEAGQ